MSTAAKVLEQARQRGVQLEAHGGRLAYDAPPDVSPDLLDQLRQHKPEILELLRRERRELLDVATPESRVGRLSAIIGTLSPSRVPRDWPAATWPQFVADAETFCREWAEEASRLGWPDCELFGCHRRAPWARVQGMGLVLLLRGKHLAAMTAAEAVIRAASGPCLTYRRKERDPLHPAERCLIWELDHAC